MPDITLAPCPLKHEVKLGVEYDHYTIRCCDCGLTLHHEGMSVAFPILAEQWNHRALPPLVQSVIEAAKAERLAERQLQLVIAEYEAIAPRVQGRTLRSDDFSANQAEKYAATLKASEAFEDAQIVRINAVDALLSESKEPT